MKKRLKTKPADQWTDPVAPPSGARFVPVDAGNGVGWGVLRRELADQRNDLREFVFDKTHPIRAQRQGGFLDQWLPTATMDVLLPDDAPAELMDARRLAERYEAEAFPGIKDLAICVSLKIHRPDQVLADWVRIAPSPATPSASGDTSQRLRSYTCLLDPVSGVTCMCI